MQENYAWTYGNGYFQVVDEIFFTPNRKFLKSNLLNIKSLLLSIRNIPHEKNVGFHNPTINTCPARTRSKPGISLTTRGPAFNF